MSSEAERRQTPEAGDVPRSALRTDSTAHDTCAAGLGFASWTSVPGQGWPLTGEACPGAHSFSVAPHQPLGAHGWGTPGRGPCPRGRGADPNVQEARESAPRTACVIGHPQRAGPLPAWRGVPELGFPGFQEGTASSHAGSGRAGEPQSAGPIY